MADIIELVYADHDWLRRQFFRLDDAKSDDELAAIWDALGTPPRCSCRSRGGGVLPGVAEARRPRRSRQSRG